MSIEQLKRNPTKTVYMEQEVEIDPMEYIGHISTESLMDELLYRKDAFKGMTRDDKVQTVFNMSNGFGDSQSNSDIDKVNNLLESLESRQFWYE